MKTPIMFSGKDVETVLDSLPISILTTDSSRKILAANTAALELFGFKREELIGQFVEVLLPSRFSDNHPKLYESFLRAPSTRAMGKARDLWAKKKCGEEFPVEVGLTVLTIEPTLILASVLDLTLRRQAEELLKERQALLESNLEEAKRVIEEQVSERTRLEERQRLGRELHDSLSQSLYGIGLGVRTALAKVSQQADPNEPLNYCLDLTESALVEMRALLFKLRPKTLENVPLSDVLKSHAQALAARTQIEVDFEHHQELTEELEFNRKYALYRVVTEALHNCTKHAQASRIVITLRSSRREVSVSIEDDGCGFTPGLRAGHGLSTMRERAENLGGNFLIESSPDGTLVSVKIPRG